jgi:hypothetical protein
MERKEVLMGAFSRWFDRWSFRTQAKEIQTFIDGLAGMDASEIGLVVVVATHLRNELEDDGYRLMDPLVDFPRDPSVVLRLRRLVRECQKAGQTVDAAGVMVWLHTMRVGRHHELRPQAREMWRHLGRGFPYVNDAASGLLRKSFKIPRIDGASTYPAGLTPDPL